MRFDVAFRETKIDHVDRLMMWCQTNNAISELNIPMKDASTMHKFQSQDLKVTQGLVNRSNLSYKEAAARTHHLLSDAQYTPQIHHLLPTLLE